MGLKSKMKNIIKQLRTKEMVPIPQPINIQKVLEGKIALITGGSGGIGFAMAEAFMKCGAKVIIAGTNEKKLDNCCEKLTTLSHEINSGGGQSITALTSYSMCLM